MLVHLFDDLKRVFVGFDLGVLWRKTWMLSMRFAEKLGYFNILVVRRGHWCLR